jgi:hypothetical protein
MTQPQGHGKSPQAIKPGQAAAGGYQIVTLQSSTGISQVFATLAGADRALPAVRQVYPDAYITQVSGFDFHRK